MSNPFGYSETWGIERHMDDLIGRLGEAIKRINTAKSRIRELEQALQDISKHTMESEDDIDFIIDACRNALRVADRAAQK